MFQLNHKQSMKKKITVSILTLLLIFGSFYGGILISKMTEFDDTLINKDYVYIGSVLNKYKESARKNVSNDVDFQLFWDVWDLIMQKYVDADQLKEKEMFYGALRGLVASTGDPYTVFMNPVISKEFSNDLKGTFEGIGAEIGIKGGVLTIIAPLTDMPAQKAGLRSGDKVLAINGDETTGIAIDQAVNKIRGPKNTEVILTIWREGFEQPKDFSITREKINFKSVRWEMNNDEIMVIKISHFNHDTEELFGRAVRDTIKEAPEGVILDLRGNPGGYMDTAIEVASEWIEEGVIVSEKFGDGEKREYLARGRARLTEFPTIVLVNEGSASASEIVAGALKDYGKAKIVGRQTFGKGSVQELSQMQDGSSVKITIAKWLTPEGTNISHEGIAPDEDIELTREDYEADKDPQMEKAINLLLEN